MAEYTEELCDLACQHEWPEDILVNCFKDGLNDDLYNACVVRGDTATLHDWCVLAEEVEINQARDKYYTVKSWKRLPLEKKEVTKPKASQADPPPVLSVAKRDTKLQNIRLAIQPRK